MHSSTWARVLFASALATLAGGCEPYPGSGTSSATGTRGTGEPAEAPAGVQALYAPLSAATPDVLKGVWSVASTNKDGTADVRFRFQDTKITGGVRCTFPSRGETLLTGDETSLVAPELTQASGSFRLGESLSFAAQKDDLACKGQLAALSWTYAISGTTMTLSAVEADGAVTLTKVGD